MTKREAEIIEQIVRSMTEREYWDLVGWLANGIEGPLWEPRRKTADDRRKAAVDENFPVMVSAKLQ
jgi:hypothetical protein